MSAKTFNEWMDYLIAEFNAGSDRSAVIVTSAIIEELLRTILKRRLIPCPNAKDPLFDGPTAPFSNFASKIDAAYRLGMIDNHMCRDLHILRSIRNEFAHEIEGGSLEVDSHRAKIEEVYRSQLLGRMEDTRTSRKKYFAVASWMLFVLTARLDEGPDTLEPYPFRSVYRIDARTFPPYKHSRDENPSS